MHMVCSVRLLSFMWADDPPSAFISACGKLQSNSEATSTLDLVQWLLP